MCKIKTLILSIYTKEFRKEGGSFMNKKNNNSDDMTLKEVQYLIKRIEKGTLNETKDDKSPQQKRENGQRLVLKLIEEFGELAENIRKNVRYDGKNIKGTIEEEVFDVFYYIIAIANDYEIDLEKIFYIKDELNEVKYDRKFSIYEAREKWKNKNKEK